MIPAASLLVGLCLGALGVWWLQRQELVYLRAELKVATDRLVHAWKEGAVISPRPVETVPVAPLPPELLDAVNEWESPESRLAEEAAFREKLAHGWGVKAILKERENNHP
jgi:hypothetical protein